MREILMLVLALSVIGSVAGLVCHSSLSPITKATLATVALSVMLSPMLSLLSETQDGLPNIKPTMPPQTDGYIEVGEGAFCEGIALAVEERFSLSRGEVSVICHDFDFVNMRAGDIRLSLFGAALLIDYREMCSYVEENFTNGGRCYIDELGWQ